MKWCWIHTLIALVLSVNYFCFQVEIFDSEYEENHPPFSITCSITSPTLTWESFDKDTAQKAFVFDAFLRTELLFVLRSHPSQVVPPVLHLQPVQDKSPPFL